MIKIGGIQKLTLIDYPDKIAATVFLTGCNFRCPFCYSAEIVLPEKIKKHPKVSEKELFKFLKERQGLIEGIVLCGGEPTISKDLVFLAGKIKKMGFFVKLDTNGSNPEMLEKLIGKKLIDYVAMDIKAPFSGNPKSQDPNSKIQNTKYSEATGVIVDLEKIKKSIEIIRNSGIDYEFRTTVVPGVHKKEDILEIAKIISGARKYYLQNFRAEKTIDKKFEKIKPYPLEFLLEIQKAISPFFEVCHVR